MADVVVINGKSYSWGSTVFKVNGVEYKGINKISYGDKLEKGTFTGTGPGQVPMAVSTGKYACDPFKIEGLKSTTEAIRADVAALSSDGTSYGEKLDNIITLQYVESDLTLITVEAFDAGISVDSSDHSESADPLVEPMEFQPRYLVRNGKTLFRKNRAQ